MSATAEQQGQLLLLLQTKATKPQHATAKCLFISVAWAEEGRFLSTAPLQNLSVDFISFFRLRPAPDG